MVGTRISICSRRIKPGRLWLRLKAAPLRSSVQIVYRAGRSEKGKQEALSAGVISRFQAGKGNEANVSIDRRVS